MLLIAFAGTVADAGPWTQDSGAGFLSFGTLVRETDASVDTDPLVYVEYGWSDDLTLGADAFRDTQSNLWAASVFAVVPFGQKDGDQRTSATLGFGLVDEQDETVKPTIRAGLSWGRGLQTGWLAVDASATYLPQEQAARPKLDMTWGQNWTDQISTILQVQAGQGFDGNRYANLAPSVVYRFENETAVNVGLVAPVQDTGSVGIKIESWINF